ncbi:hypothetical protein CALVIDRAFT_597227 [Calocera viscosa TUFC12733]|uniref:NAD dependent epimerase/dehydratase n=1 Tax=Calocera viscosa (strain TUFC12733) TaxID=1330018 RepID=A0A167NI72_CALVF|nr:hypothetical protein CALVIDRAFT_597227 [Calocera viscosa TUFC12733]
MSNTSIHTTASTQPQIRVTGAGLGRTGTSSLKEALEILGFGPCHHMAELPGRMGRCWAFVDAYHGKPTDWRVLMAGWGSTVDHPTADFVPELIVAFPEAKVILTERDNASVWWKSYTDTVWRLNPLWNGVLMWSVPPAFAMWSVGRNVDSFKKRTYGFVGPEAYGMHKARMKAIVPKEKLLVFNVKEGWEPLCTFLGADVPKIPFPRNNETKDMQKRFFIMRTVGITAWLVEVGLLALIIRKAMNGGWFKYLDMRKLLFEF